MKRPPFNPAVIRADVIAGITIWLVAIPKTMAITLLGGVSPLYGLYGVMAGLPFAVLVNSSQFMFVGATAGLMLGVGSVLASYPTGEWPVVMGTLTVLTGVVCLLFGLLRLGGLLRFVSQSVMLGFLSGIAVIIMLGQIEDLTGFDSAQTNRVLQTLDTLLHVGQVDLPTTVIGVGSVLLIVLLGRTPLRQIKFIVTVLGATAVVSVLGWSDVARVSDIAAIPAGLPPLVLPDLRLAPELVLPALSLAIIALVQGSGVSKSVPNSNGEFPNASRDFMGQGLANLAAGLFQGIPVGGAVGETSVNLSAGAKTRLANGIAAGLLLASVALFGEQIGQVVMPAIAALLVVAGYEALKFSQILDVLRTDWTPRVLFGATFVATLFLPVQYAVFLGVGLSLLSYLYRTSVAVAVVEHVVQPDGAIHELPAPTALVSGQPTVLVIRGDLYFGSAATVESLLPPASQAERAVVIFDVRGLPRVGATVFDLFDRYGRALSARGGKLMLCGVDPRVAGQIERRRTRQIIDADDIFPAELVLGESTRKAVAAARAWLAQETRPA